MTPSGPGSADAASAGPFPRLAGKSVLLVSHELTRTGAPLVLLELGLRLRRSGARVELVSLRDHPDRSALVRALTPRLVPETRSLEAAAAADCVIASTALAYPWIQRFVAAHPDGARRLVWWIHENDTALYGAGVASLDPAGALVFDSHASLGAWRATGLRLSPEARVIHPCVRPALAATAARDRGPFAAGLVRRALGRLGVPPPAQGRREARAALGVRDGDFLLSMFAPPSVAKGHDLLVRTAGRILRDEPWRGLKLLMIGFSQRRRARRFLAGLDAWEGRAIHARRALPSVEDLAPFYRATDAYVMNSQGCGETFGLVSIEAMAFGLPVLGTDAGGTPEIVLHERTGLLHPVGEEGQAVLARHIRRLMDDRALGPALGAAGRERARRHFGDERFCAAWRGILESIAG